MVYFIANFWTCKKKCMPSLQGMMRSHNEAMKAITNMLPSACYMLPNFLRCLILSVM
jgi:hypothetical protein